jgi:hypothetical protein
MADADAELRRRIGRLPAAVRERARELLDLPDLRSIKAGGQLQPDGSRLRLWHEGRPAELVDYFQRGLEAVARLEAREVELTSGRIEYPVRPTPPPTLDAFAASIGASRRVLSEWSRKHPAFREAMDWAKTAQAAAAQRLAALGALAAPVAALLLRHLADWTDKLEVEARVSPGAYAIRGGPLDDGTRPTIDVAPPAIDAGAD